MPPAPTRSLTWLPTRLLPAPTVPSWLALLKPVVPSTRVEAPRVPFQFGLDTT